jgi:hypothetical protein
MAGNQSIIEPLIEKIEAYGNTSLDLIKLKSIDKASTLAANFTSRLVALFSISMFVIVASIGIALWLGEACGKLYYGFYLVGGGYGVLGLVLYFVAHNWIKKGISDSIISQILN